MRQSLFLSCLLIVTVLSSCTEGSLGRLRHARAGAIGIGPTGAHPGDRLLPRLKPESREEMQVHLAVRRGVERALADSRAFNYMPFVTMKNVPEQVTPATQFEEVKKFAAANNLDAVVRVWVIPNLNHGSVSVSFLTNARDSKFIASGLALAPASAPLADSPTARKSLPLWEKTAYAAMQKALAKVRG
ncbi:MAG: hypothetical protein ACO1TE_05245 [Prosthecobacter sp.]